MSQLDGYMARRLGIHSVLGSYLDPLADKVSIESLFTFYTCVDSHFPIVKV